MLTVHRALGTWDRHVSAFIALSEFARSRFLAGGLPADRLHIKPNFVEPDPGNGAHRGGYLLYVGRLSPEKGIETLLEAWRLLSTPSADRAERELVLVGDGPLGDAVQAAGAALPGLRWEGRQPKARVLELMRDARALILPSLCYENFPSVLAEAFACGLPVLGSRLGSIAELIRDGETGRLFDAGDVQSLADVMRWASAAATDLSRLSRAARREFESRYTAEINLRRLLDIYRVARGRTGRS
jgi:glycosyltransferase involved in cell wall biosynthesis